MAVLSSQDVRAGATVSITANGTTRVNGTITWTAPPAPALEISLTSIRFVADMYTWSGRGNFTITINNRQITSGAAVDVTLPITATSPYAITGVGGNKNSTGANCSFTNPMIIYTYQIEGGEELMVMINGTLQTVQAVYKMVNGQLVEQTDLASLFDTNTKYVIMN